jgi:hypothetical protein
MLIKDAQNQPVSVYGMEKSNPGLHWSHPLALDERLDFTRGMSYWIDFQDILDRERPSNQVSFGIMHERWGLRSRFHYVVRFDEGPGVRSLVFPSGRDAAGMEELQTYLKQIGSTLSWGAAKVDRDPDASKASGPGSGAGVARPHEEFKAPPPVASRREDQQAQLGAGGLSGLTGEERDAVALMLDLARQTGSR